MVAKEKIYVFRKSALDISSLIIRATKVDLSVCLRCLRNNTKHWSEKIAEHPSDSHDSYRLS